MRFIRLGQPPACSGAQQIRGPGYHSSTPSSTPWIKATACSRRPRWGWVGTRTEASFRTGGQTDEPYGVIGMYHYLEHVLDIRENLDVVAHVTSTPVRPTIDPL